MLMPVYLLLLLLLKPFNNKLGWHDQHYKFPFTTALVRYIWLFAVIFKIVTIVEATGMMGEQSELDKQQAVVSASADADKNLSSTPDDINAEKEKTSELEKVFAKITDYRIMQREMLAAEQRTYQRHRPEQTLLYQLVEKHYPTFAEMMQSQGKALPYHVIKEFEEFLKCGRLEHGFLRVVCDDCKHEKLVAFSCKRRGFCPICGARRMAESAKLLVDDVLQGYPVRQWVLSLPILLRLLLARSPKELSNFLQIVYRAISTDIIHRSGYLKKQAKTGAVTYIQRFGSALNLNIHFHMLFLEGVITQEHGKMTFKRVKAPSHSNMEALVNTISQRIAQYLEKAGLIQRDIDNTYLDLPIDDEDSLLPLQAASVSYRIAVGADTGKKVFT